MATWWRRRPRISTSRSAPFLSFCMIMSSTIFLERGKEGREKKRRESVSREVGKSPTFGARREERERDVAWRIDKHTRERERETIESDSIFFSRSCCSVTIGTMRRK